MYQIAVKNGVVNNLTWKRLRGGRALVRAFEVARGRKARANIRFDERSDAAMVAEALRKSHGLAAEVQEIDWRRT